MAEKNKLEQLTQKKRIRFLLLLRLKSKKSKGTLQYLFKWRVRFSCR